MVNPSLLLSKTVVVVVMDLLILTSPGERLTSSRMNQLVVCTMLPGNGCEANNKVVKLEYIIPDQPFRLSLDHLKTWCSYRFYFFCRLISILSNFIWFFLDGRHCKRIGNFWLYPSYICIRPSECKLTIERESFLNLVLTRCLQIHRSHRPRRLSSSAMSFVLCLSSLCDLQLAKFTRINLHLPLT